MTTRYEFGYGYGEIYRRRMRAQERMHRELERELRRLPPRDRERTRYESDYYGFRGAGRRSTYDIEFRVQPRVPERMSDGGRRFRHPRAPAARRPRRHRR